MCADKSPLRLAGVLILTGILALFFCCKKNPTVPQIEDTSRPVIWLNQYALEFTTSETAGNPDGQTLSIKNTGPGTLDYTILSDADWASVTPESGSSAGQEVQHTITVNKAGLEPGDDAHAATLTITCSQAYNNPQEVAVRFHINKGVPPKIWVESQLFTFNAQEGGPDPSAQDLKIRNEGQGTLHYELSANAPWISVNPPTGSTAGALKVHKVAAQVSGLHQGTYSGKITVRGTSASNSPQSIEVTLKIAEDEPPRIGLSTQSLAFSALQGGSGPSPKSFTVWNAGGGTLKYTISCDAGWLSVTPISGQTGGADRSHSVFADTAGMGAGSYQGTIQVADPDASNTPRNINVSLSVTSPPTDNAISLSCSPSSARTGTIVSFPVKIRGNLTEISVFGLDMTYDASIFQFHSTVEGSLTGAWAAVDGNAISPGTVKIGGFAGSASPIPISSEGTIVIVKLKVISTASANKQTQVWIKNYIDDIQGLKPSSASTGFTYLK